jgi:hypothetical protein
LTVVALALAGAACEYPPNPVVTSPANVPVFVETFTGTLVVGGARFYSYSLSTAGAVSVTLISLREAGADSTTVVGLGIGSPSGTGCAPGTNTVTKAGSSPQLSGSYDPGVYCAVVYDTGQVTAPLDFVINIAHPR